MSAEVVPYTDRADWLTKRRGGIGASDIAAIVGVSPWATPLQVWSSKLVDLPDDPDEAMAWGTRLEPVILDAWQSEEGRNPVTRRGVLLRNIERPWMMVTLDGETMVGQADFDGSGLDVARWERAVVEAKASSDWSWDEIPTHYVVQVEWALAVTGYRRAIVVVLHGGRKLETYEYVSDPELRAELISAGEEFWKLIENDDPPPVEAGDLSFLSGLWPTSEEAAVEIPQDAADELYEARRLYTTAKERKERAEAAVKALMTTYDTAVVDQDVICTWRSNPVRRIDVKRLRAELPSVAERFETVSEERRFLVKEKKE